MKKTRRPAPGFAPLWLSMVAGGLVAFSLGRPAADVTGTGLATASETQGTPGGQNPLAAVFPVSFDSERIRLHIVGDTLEVRGTYWLLCLRPTSSPLSLIYPFPRDSLLGGARMVSLHARVGTLGEAPISWENVAATYSGVRWIIPPCSSDTIEIESVYRQKILTRYARYIVTTTRAWEQPLKHAAFEIHLPPGAKPVEFSFPFKKVTGSDYYAYEESEFFPDRDITVRWEP
jgi:hypothetical protein